MYKNMPKINDNLRNTNATLWKLFWLHH